MPRAAWWLLAILLGPMSFLVAGGLFMLFLYSAEGRSPGELVLPGVLLMLAAQYYLVRLAYRQPSCPESFAWVAYAAAILVPVGWSFLTQTSRELEWLGVAMMAGVGSALAGLPMLVAWLRGRND